MITGILELKQENMLGEDWKPHEDIDWHHTTGEILYDILEQQVAKTENGTD
jgi:hypothetical protein